MAENAAAFTGSIPELYDRHLGPVIFEPYAEDLVARFDAPAGAHVLELACGTGIVTRRLLAKLPADARLTATDLNPAMLDDAGQRVPADPRLTWRVADAMSLPFDAASFDRIVCQFGVMFFPDKRVAATDARRVLRPRGVYQFNVWGPIADNAFARVAHETIASFFPSDPPQFYMTPFGYHDEAQIRADLAAAGFAAVSIDTVDKPALSVSAADLATGLVRGNPVIGTIQERGTVDAATVEAAVAAALTRAGGARPFRSTLRARVVTARA